ncbi:hypothetical protein B0T20DRAFT_495702 [Sordaria brevicollis]|uniref:Uncharacterized protein n=1 Tax=Sordaria brevicollis TaxID=83679 RepID=A0AAE0PGW5_SORBR|nr:hypothetical protein B0T20DRAFT_495702 [Sordaria brevicollis]
MYAATVPRHVRRLTWTTSLDSQKLLGFCCYGFAHSLLSTPYLYPPASGFGVLEHDGRYASTNSSNSLAQISFGSDPVQPPGQHVADFATLLSVPCPAPTTVQGLFLDHPGTWPIPPAWKAWPPTSASDKYRAVVAELVGCQQCLVIVRHGRPSPLPNGASALRAAIGLRGIKPPVPPFRKSFGGIVRRHHFYDRKSLNAMCFWQIDDPFQPTTRRRQNDRNTPPLTGCRSLNQPEPYYDDLGYRHSFTSTEETALPCQGSHADWIDLVCRHI